MIAAALAAAIPIRASDRDAALTGAGPVDAVGRTARGYRQRRSPACAADNRGPAGPAGSAGAAGSGQLISKTTVTVAVRSWVPGWTGVATSGCGAAPLTAP